MNFFHRVRLITLLLCLALPASQIPADAVLDLRVFPPEYKLFSGTLELNAADGSGARRRYLLADSSNLTIAAAGYRALKLNQLSAGDHVETKLERADSDLRLAGILATGRQPKSITVSPDGMFLCVPLLNDDGIDIYTTAPLNRVRRIAPGPRDAARVGFVESVWLETRNELWVSQMTTSKVHIFDSRNFSYLESVDIEGNWPKVLIADEEESRIYVSNWLSEDISVIDTASRSVVKRIPTGGIPRGMAFDHTGRHLLATLYDRGDVVVIATDTERVAHSISGEGGAMRHIIRDPRRNLFYASDMYHGTVYRFAAGDISVGEPLYLGPKINTIDLSPDGSLLFASSRGPNNKSDYTLKGPEFGKIFVIDTAAWKIIDWTWGGNQPTGLAVGSRGHYIFFSDFLDDRIEVYRLRRGETSDKNWPAQ